MVKILSIVFLTLFMSHQVFSQQRTISGNVSSVDDDSPVIGASVSVKDGSSGTVTDTAGNFSLTVDTNARSLVFQSIGMQTTEFKIGASNSIDIRMNTDKGTVLQEVVVTAVGIERQRRTLGYAVQSVTAAEIVNSREPNLVNALAAKVAGVQVTSSSGSPGASSTIKIRGNNSLTGDFQPLFVIDGVPIDNSEESSAQDNDGNVPFTQGAPLSNRAVDINPDDIESLTILKGPAAASLYGLRAGNGAIIITTKRGKSKGGKPVLSVSSSFSIDKVNKLPELQNKYAQGSDGEYSGPETGASGSWGPLIESLRYNGASDYLYDKNGALVSSDDPTATSKRANVYDNAGSFFQTGKTFNNSISLSGGGDKFNYYTSVSSLYQQGIIPTTDFKRTSFRTTIEARLTKKFKILNTFNYINSGGKRAQQGSNTSGIMLGLLRTTPTFDNSNGYKNAADHPESYLIAGGLQRNYRGGGGYDNPNWSVNKNPFTDNVDRLIGSTQLDYQFTDWVKATYRIGVDVYSDFRTGGFDLRSRAYPLGRIFEDKINNRDITSDLFLTFNKELGKVFTVTAIVGHNFFNHKFDKVYSQGDNVVIPGFLALSNTSVFNLYQSRSEIKRYAGYADVTFGLLNRYYLNFTGRNEWSSTLPKSNNSYFFPGVNLSYVFTEDLAKLGLNTNGAFNFGKLRISYASVGRDAPAYSIKTIYGTPKFNDGYTEGVSFPFNGVAGFGAGTTTGSTQPVLGNSQIKPEINTTFEVGTQLEFFQKRFILDVNLYNAQNKNNILLAPIASSTGFQYLTVNTGRLENKGIEISGSITPVRSSKFDWTANVNYTLNRNKVIALAPGVDNIFQNGFTGSGSFLIPGQPAGMLFGGKWLRDGSGRQVIGEDGYPLVDPQQGILGNPNPKYMLGFRNTFTYGGLSLSVLFDYRQGGQMWNGTRGTLVNFGTAKETEVRGDSTIFSGVVADADGNPTETINTQKVALDQAWYQGNGGGFGSQSESFIEDASFFRCREMTLAFAFPSKVVKHIGMGSLNLSLYARNLFLVTKYSGVDPETNLTGTSNGFGLDYYNMPNTKSYGINLRASF